jgi:hypothetical protein
MIDMSTLKNARQSPTQISLLSPAFSYFLNIKRSYIRLRLWRDVAFSLFSYSPKLIVHRCGKQRYRPLDGALRLQGSRKERGLPHTLAQIPTSGILAFAP